MRKVLGVWMGSMLLAMAVSGQADPRVEDVEIVEDAGSAEAQAARTEVTAPQIQLVSREFICSRFTPTIGGEICHAGVDRERNIQVFRNGRVVAVTPGGWTDRVDQESLRSSKDFAVRIFLLSRRSSGKDVISFTRRDRNAG